MADLDETSRQKVVEYFDVLDSVRGNDEAVNDFYDKISRNYDEVNLILGRRETFEKFSEDTKRLCCNEKDPQDLKLIDIGAGTGFLGEALVKAGFKDIDALEPAKAMLQQSITKNIYRNTFNEFLTDQPTSGINDNTYDIATCIGCYVEGHIPISTVVELARMVKTGGYVIFTLYDPGFTMNYMQGLGGMMKQRLVELISMQLQPYKREFSQDFQFVHAYTVCLKVL